MALPFCLFFGLLGCGDQTKEANDLINKRNEHYKAAEGYAKELIKLSSEIGQAKNTEELKSERDAIENKKGVSDKAEKELDEGLDDLEEAKDLSINPDFKTYIDMLIKADKKRIEMVDLLGKLLNEAAIFYDFVIANPNATAEQLQPYTDKMQEYSKEITDMESEVNKLDEDAKKWYQDKKLGNE